MLYLASKSPRRAELLKQIRLKFDIIDCSVDESPLLGESPQEMVCRLACAKAQTGIRSLEQIDHRHLVLAADTLIDIDGVVLGKPANSGDCHSFLRRLSGRSHRVVTAVALATADRLIGVECNISEVEFGDVDEDMIRCYCASGEPMDKAGAYAIQGLGAIFIKHIKGSYSAIMGLPLYETAQLLKQAGYPLLESYNDH